MLEINLKSKDPQKRSRQAEQREIVCAAPINSKKVVLESLRLPFPLRCSFSSGVKCQPVVVWWGQGGIALIKAALKPVEKIRQVRYGCTVCSSPKNKMLSFSLRDTICRYFLLSRKNSSHSCARAFPGAVNQISSFLGFSVSPCNKEYISICCWNTGQSNPSEV